MSNPYAPPSAKKLADDSEASIRRDGNRLVLSLHGGLHSMCAHCGSDHDLESRVVPHVWRNPIGCLSTLALVCLIVVLAMISDSVGMPAGILGWVALAVLGAVVVVNVLWRSRRVELNYALCLSCRARRGRWLIGWALFLLVFALTAFLVGYPVLLMLAMPLLVAAERLQPAAIRPARVRDERVWIKGVRRAVLDRFPPLNEGMSST